MKRNYKRGRRLVIKAGRPRPPIPDLYPAGVDFSVPPTGRTLIRGGTVLSLDPARRPRPGRRPRRGERDPRRRTGPVQRRGRSRRLGDDRDARVRRLPPAHLGGPAPQHRDRRAARGHTSYISFVLQSSPRVPARGRLRRQPRLALGAIDAGITTLLDWSHIQGSPAHTDAVIQALKDSGLRAVFAGPWWGKWEERQPSWFVRAATEYFSTKDEAHARARGAQPELPTSR